MYIDSWVKKHTYDTFKEVLGSGMQCHLQVRAASCLSACPWGGLCPAPWRLGARWVYGTPSA